MNFMTSPVSPPDFIGFQSEEWFTPLSVNGTCPICGPNAEFRLENRDFRNHFVCMRCQSIPRERALFEVLKSLYPNWPDLSIHESSPIRRGASEALRSNCPGYTFSQYDPSIPWGDDHKQLGHRSEDLEHLTFDDETFDVFVTQDVFEHIFHPDLAAKEIARVLKPGGAHILTTPLVNKNLPSQRRSESRDGKVHHLLPPVYHGNPMSENGSLVTVDWGFDLLQYLNYHSGLPSMLFYYDDFSRGIHAPLIEVVVMLKGKIPEI